MYTFNQISTPFWDGDYKEFIDKLFERDEPQIPSMKYYDDENHTIKLFCAGTEKENIKIEIVENRIIISGEIEKPENFDDYDYVSTNIRFGKWEYKIPIVNEMNLDNIEAKYENGVLEIIIPTKEKERKVVKIK